MVQISTHGGRLAIHFLTAGGAPTQRSFTANWLRNENLSVENGKQMDLFNENEIV